MQQPFDIIVADIHYAVFPEPEDTFTIYKDAKEYLQIQKDDENQWLKLDDETALPLFEPNEEVNLIGRAISEYKEEEEDHEDDLLDDEDEY
jgi:hypothetical protein